MTTTRKRKNYCPVKREANKQFFLYVFFHSIWTSIINAFED